MLSLLKRHQELVLYTVVGAFSSAVNLIVYFGLVWGLHVNYLLANLAAWTATVLFAYAMDKRFVFHSRCESLSALFVEFAAFVNGRILSGLMDMLLMWLLAGVLSFDNALVKFFNSGLVVTMNFLFSKFFVFTQKKK